MADWTNVPDSNLLPGKPAKSADFIAMKDNITALAEGAAGAPRVLTAAIGDANVTTVKLATNERMTTANVVPQIAGAAVYAVGSYIFAISEGRTSYLPGSTVSGSAIRPFGIGGESLSNDSPVRMWHTGTGIPGSWRCMGYAYGNNSLDSYFQSGTLWLRIS